MTKLANATIPVEDASIQRRQVTVEVLTLDKRQVTQSFYKQLVCDTDVIDTETCELKGKVWGWVNLHIDCDVDRSHLHVIWEKEGRLYRSCTYYDCSQFMYIHSRSHLHNLTRLYCYLQVFEKRAYNLKIFTEPTKYSGVTTTMVRVFVKKRLIDVPVDSCIRTMNGSQLIEEVHEIKRELDFCGYRIWDKGIPTSEECYERMEKEAETMNIEESRWRQTYKQIYDTGQLFIAVSGVWK